MICYLNKLLTVDMQFMAAYCYFVGLCLASDHKVAGPQALWTASNRATQIDHLRHSHSTTNQIETKPNGLVTDATLAGEWNQPPSTLIIKTAKKAECFRARNCN